MQLKRIAVKNLASFIDFRNEVQFERNTLIFGSNGSGKSTLVGLLQSIDTWRKLGTPQSEHDLRTFLQNRISKETGNRLVEVEIEFSSKSHSLSYDTSTDQITVSGDFWSPVKVFNDRYTALTIGDSFHLDFESQGIAIGEANRQLEEARETRDSLLTQREQKMEEVERVVAGAVQEFRDETKSTANVDNAISVETLLSATCDFALNDDALRRRHELGYSRPNESIDILDVRQFRIPFDLEGVEHLCTETVSEPLTDDKTTRLLNNYTEFFKKGVDIFRREQVDVCPFCRREWPEASHVVEEYRQFIESTYNERREAVKRTRQQIEQYKDQVQSQVAVVDARREAVGPTAEKYAVALDDWRPLRLAEKEYQDALGLIDEKYNHMESAVSVSQTLRQLEAVHTQAIDRDNELLAEIRTAIDSVSTTRGQLNKTLVGHFAKKMWVEGTTLRQELSRIDQLISDKEAMIARIEEQNPPQDVVRAVFNELAAFMGLAEYSIDESRRLNLRFGDKELYDISNEGRRLSSAQRKILSLCYFFSEIVAECKNVGQLRNYALVFDDPVDSADYIFFHSITALIEKADIILTKILGSTVKFGQFIVFTHNSLLYDRLNSSHWRDRSWSIRKEAGATELGPAEKTINNYAEYIRAISRYFKNPHTAKNDMIYIGNVIRRVLEILASFESLGSNNFQDLLDGAGKTKLALLANHLSHESFSRVVNPLSSSEEVREACQQVFELIRERHNEQYQTIRANYGVRLPDDPEAPTT